MHGHDTTNEAVGARDQRPPSLGLGRIIIALFWLLGAWILVTAVLDLFHAQGQPWGPRIVALLAGIDYLIAATALTHNGRRMRILGGVALAIATIQCLVGFAFDEATYGAAWAGGGAALSYVPLVSCLLGAVWMWASNPRRIVQNAERITDIKRELAEKTAS